MASPFEPRIAVLIRRDRIGTEAAVVPLVHVFGAQLQVAGTEELVRVGDRRQERPRAAFRLPGP